MIPFRSILASKTLATEFEQSVILRWLLFIVNRLSTYLRDLSNLLDKAPLKIRILT